MDKSVSEPKRGMTDLNLKTGRYHAREDILPPFLASFLFETEVRKSVLSCMVSTYGLWSIVSTVGKPILMAEPKPSSVLALFFRLCMKISYFE